LETSFKSILLPIDGSLQSKIAQELALYVSKLFSSHVTVMHIVSNQPLSLPGRVYLPTENYAPISNATGQFPRALRLPKTKEYTLSEEVAKEVIDEYKTKEQSLLDQAVSLFTQEGIVAKEKLVEAADVADSVISEAEAGKYDLIIMDNGGSQKKDEFGLSRASAKVSSSAKVPIIIVRNKTEVKKILIPVDGSTKDEKTLESAKIIGKATESKILLLHVQEKSLLKLKPEIKEVGLQILNHASGLLEGLQVETKLIPGDPAESILHISKQEDIDLIIMNSGKHEALKARLLGSVSHHVLQNATIPVMLIK
jgi:nucleotide-binding universal stress UspA family protein